MTAPEGQAGFNGAKVALFCEGRLLVYLRDDLPGLPWPNMWDLPGGGREGSETPEECLLREVQEEFGLCLPAARLTDRREWPAMTGGPGRGFFFAGHLERQEIASIRFGSEGQRWEMMETARFLADPRSIPALVERVRAVLHSPGFGGKAVRSALGRSSPGI